MRIKNELSEQFVDIPVSCCNIFMWLSPPPSSLLLVGGDTFNNASHEWEAHSGYLKQKKKKKKGLGLFKRSLAELETSGVLGAIYSVLWGDPEKSHPHDIGSQCKDWGIHCQLRAFVWTFKAFMSCLSQPPFLTAMKAVQKVKFLSHEMKFSDIFLFAFVPDQEEKSKFFHWAEVLVKCRVGNMGATLLKRTI